MKIISSAMSALGIRLKSTLVAFAMLPALLPVIASAEDAGVVEAGKNRFMQYCAVCHGEDAKGNGPFAALLNKQPPDLTVLTKNNGGTFPFFRVFKAIDGRADLHGAHGSKDMPIWGGEWKGSSLAAETALRGRILEMIIYLDSVQQQ